MNNTSQLKRHPLQRFSLGDYITNENGELEEVMMSLEHKITKNSYQLQTITRDKVYNGTEDYSKLEHDFELNLIREESGMFSFKHDGQITIESTERAIYSRMIEILLDIPSLRIYDREYPILGEFQDKHLVFVDEEGEHALYQRNFDLIKLAFIEHDDIEGPYIYIGLSRIYLKQFVKP